MGLSGDAVGSGESGGRGDRGVLFAVQAMHRRVAACFSNPDGTAALPGPQPTLAFRGSAEDVRWCLTFSAVSAVSAQYFPGNVGPLSEQQ